MSKLRSWSIASLICMNGFCMNGCRAPEREMPPMESRAAENVSPDMVDKALKGLHSEDAKLQMSGLRFIESFPELKQQHLARIETLAKSGKDAKICSQAARILK